MSSPLDNPAGRLSAFLQSLPARGSSTTIGEVLNIPIDSDEAFAVPVRMLEIRGQMQQCREALEALPADEDPEFLLQNFPEIERAVDAMTESAFAAASRIAPTGTFSPSFPSRRVSTEALLCLEAASRALHRCSPEPAINQEQLSELVEYARGLIDAVRDSDSLTGDAKIFLVKRIREIEAALLSIQVSGFTDIEDAMDRLTGALVRREDLREQGILGKIGVFFQKLVQAAQGTSALTGATSSTLEAIQAITKLKSGG